MKKIIVLLAACCLQVIASAQGGLLNVPIIIPTNCGSGSGYQSCCRDSFWTFTEGENDHLTNRFCPVGIVGCGDSASQTYAFYVTNIDGDIIGGWRNDGLVSLSIFEAVASKLQWNEASVNGSNRIQVQAPTSLAGNYSLTWPTALPASTLPMTLTSAGVMSTGALTVLQGGTGLVACSQGDILYGSSANTLSVLNKSGATMRVLTNQGTSNNPVWGQVDQSTGVTGILPVPNGGTGIAATTAYSVICGGTTSTGAFQNVSGVGTSGQVLTSAGAGALPAWATSPAGGLTVVTKSISYTAAASNLVLCSTPDSSITITLPASPAANTIIGIYYKALTGTRTVTIARNGNTIDGAAANQTLYIAKDYLLVQYDGTSDWAITTDGLQPHICNMYRAAAQSISTITYTKILFDTEASGNQGGLANLTYSRVDIRRTGVYDIGASLISTMSALEEWQLGLMVNTTYQRIVTATAANTNVSAGTPLALEYYLSAGDSVKIYFYQAHGTISTSTAVEQRPIVSVAERK